jgi:outer membrane protein assembly factor BamB
MACRLAIIETVQNKSRLWLAVLSGRDGRTRWSQPLTEIQDEANSTQRYDLSSVLLEAAYADLDGDRFDDVLLPAKRTPDAATLELRTLSGVDGRILWRNEWPAPRHPSDAFRDAPPAAVGDLDGDGRLEAIMLSLTEGVDAQGFACRVVRASALDGQTGQLRWQWDAPADPASIEIGRNAERVKDRLRPILVRRPDGKLWIALATWKNAREIHVLDEAGKLVSSASKTLSYLDRGMRVWTVDAGGDGGDELLLLTETSLALLPPDKLDQPVWQQSEIRADFHRIAGVLPDPAARGRIVVTEVGRDGSLRGIDPATGDVIWTCVGPVSATPAIGAQTAVLLNLPRGELPPHVLFQHQGQAYVRRGVDLRIGQEITVGSSGERQGASRWWLG